MSTPMDDNRRQWPLYEVFIRARGGKLPEEQETHHEKKCGFHASTSLFSARCTHRAPMRSRMRPAAAIGAPR